MMTNDPDENDTIKKTIDLIAVQHGVVLGRRDPILMLQTMNDHLLQNYVDTQQKQLDSFKEELAALTQHWHLNAKEMAERILNASLAASKDAMRQIMEEGGRAAAATMQEEIERVVAVLDPAIRDTRQMMILCIVTSTVTFLAAGLVLWVALGNQVNLFWWIP